jgi:two-component system sensor histidine kinase/response regulator
MENDLMTQRILLVDDHKMSRLATQNILERLGYDVVGVGDGRDAVDAHANGGFDAAIMDCQMPRMDGFQATAEIRRREVEWGSARTPIIGLSARAMEGDSDAALAKGMDCYLTKPLSVKELRAALHRWVPPA